MTMYTVKQLIDAVNAGTITRDAAIAHCEGVIARPTATDNKRARWTRVRDGLRKAETVTVKAAFAAMATPEPTPAAKPAKAKAQPKAKAQADDPMTAIARQMEALTAAFAALAAKR